MLNIKFLSKQKILTLEEVSFLLFGELKEGSEKGTIRDEFEATVKESVRVRRLESAGYKWEAEFDGSDFEIHDLTLNSEIIFKWIIDNEIVQWIESKDIQFSKEIKELINRAGFVKKKGNKQEFPPILKDWGKLGFVINKDASITIKVGKTKKQLTPQEFEGLIPKQKPRNLLFEIIYLGGQFSKDNFDSPQKENLKSYVSSLRSTLNALFKIESNPIEFIGKGEYQTKFSCHSDLPSNPLP